MNIEFAFFFSLGAKLPNSEPDLESGSNEKFFSKPKSSGDAWKEEASVDEMEDEDESEDSSDFGI